MKRPNPYKIHFICHGNTFRSRLAAAYLATIIDADYAVSSSGLRANHADSPVVEPFAAALAKAHGLSFQLDRPRTLTTDALLAAADVLVFLQNDVYQEAQLAFNFDSRKALVWSIDDIDDGLKAEILADGSEAAMRQATEPIFQKIKAQCDELKQYMTRGSWVDVVDKADRPSGLRLPISMVSDKGLWHRGVRVIVKTSDEKFIVEKRSQTMVYGPGRLEIGVGGLIDAGELPAVAARRETSEEVGLKAPAKAFRPLFKYRVVAYHPHYKTQTRTHIYTYAVTVPAHSSRLNLQKEEVAAAYWLSKRQIKQLLRAHRLKHIGQLTWDYKLFRLAVAASELNHL